MMKSRFLMLLALAGILIISTLHVPAARAANINTSGAGTCQGVLGPNPNLIIVGSGITNAGSTAVEVMCSVPRSPLASGATSGGFYVDGFVQTSGVTMTCFLSSYDYTGIPLGSSQFVVSGKFDAFVSLPAAQLTTYAYVNLNCLLPSAASLLGVTSLQ